MNETATPTTQVDTEAEAAILPDDDSHTEGQSTETAEARSNDTQPDPQGEGETISEASAPDAELIEWAKKKGIPVDNPADLTPAALKAIEVARNGERDFHANRQDARRNKVEEATNAATTDGVDPNEDRIRRLENHTLARDFYDTIQRRDKLTDDEITALDDQISKAIETDPVFKRDGSVDLEAVYAKISRNSAKERELAAEKKGREAAKAEIARSSNAVMPKGNASGTAPTDKEDAGLQAFKKAFDGN